MKAQGPAFNRNFTYAGSDLGATCTRTAARVRVWSPFSRSITLCLYRRDVGGTAERETPMKRSAGGTWAARVPGDWRNWFYTFKVHGADGVCQEITDPCSIAVGANGRRSMLVDLAETNPKGWDKDRKPAGIPAVDSVIYELHVRDLSAHRNSGIRHTGRFLGLAERGARGPRGVATGLDHLVELGVTHVHLLPVFDYDGVEETQYDPKAYNWGYNPVHYNTPEGSYATNAHDGRVRIREFKQAILALHRQGIRVVMDVVYNHTYHAGDSHFNVLAPGYYHRTDAQGAFTNGSGCGNETASEKPMMRKFMVDSLVYWAKEYHIDGFRFDLMGLHDLQTMKEIRAALDRVDRSIILYGEGWTGGTSPLPENRRATKTNVRRLDRVAAFSDTIRDAIKGPVWDKKQAGFAAGNTDLAERVRIGIVASTRHPGVKFPEGDAWHGPWAREPGHCVTYNSCHDNHTLWDKLALSCPGAAVEDLVRMNLLAAAITLTSQGIAFIHAGEEFLRTKKGEENSYQHPDRINALDWSRKAKYREVVEFYKGLIALRKAFPAFRLQRAADIRKHLRFLDTPHREVVAYTLAGAANGPGGAELAVFFNAGARDRRVQLPAEGWDILVYGAHAGVEPVGRAKKSVTLPPRGAVVLARRNGA